MDTSSQSPKPEDQKDLSADQAKPTEQSAPAASPSPASTSDSSTLSSTPTPPTSSNSASTPSSDPTTSTTPAEPPKTPEPPAETPKTPETPAVPVVDKPAETTPASSDKPAELSASQTDKPAETAAAQPGSIQQEVKQLEEKEAQKVAEVQNQLNQASTSQVPETKAGSGGKGVIVGIIVAIALILGGVVAYNVNTNSKVHTSPMSIEKPNKPIPSPTVSSLNDDSQAVDKSMSELDNSFKNVDEGLQDQPGDVNE